MYALQQGFTLDFLTFAKSVYAKGGTATDTGFVVSLIDTA